MTGRPFIPAMFFAGLLGCQPPADTGAVDAGPAADVDLDSASGRGYLAVQARKCAVCHQSRDPTAGALSGQASPVPGTRAYGSNLTPDPDTGLDVQDAATLAASVLRGVGMDGGALCPSMPAYADAGMDASEALAIAAYLQTLSPVWHPVPSSSCAASAAGDGG